MILWDHIVLYVLWGLCLHNLINCTSLCWWGTPFVSNFWGMPWNFRSSGIRSFRQQWQQQATEGSALCQWGVHGMWMAMDLASELRWRGWKAGGLSMVNGISMGYRPSTGTGGVFFCLEHIDPWYPWHIGRSSSDTGRMGSAPWHPLAFLRLRWGKAQLWHHGFTNFQLFWDSKGLLVWDRTVYIMLYQVIAIPSTSIHQKVAHRSLFDLDILSCQTGGRYGDTILRAAGPVHFQPHRRICT